MRTVLALLALGCAAPLLAADPFEFKDGDRVVFLGSTLIEREQKYGYWELALTMANADKNITFRNLGWSGDTVWGEARNGFDASPKGYERLVQVTKDAKPTVIFIAYGTNESFEGKAGLPKFEKGLEQLLKALPTNARVVLFAPLPFQFGTFVQQNENLKAYTEAIRTVASRHKLTVADLGAQIDGRRRLTPVPEPPLTDNGMHLSELGYRYTSEDFLYSLGIRSWIETPESLKRWRTMDTEKLRAKIIEKNQLVFHQWRPQNETYLFLFRKHEQGNNAKDIPAFDPLIAKAEKEIQELKKALAK